MATSRFVNTAKSPSQRQQRVAEQVRHAISQIIIRGKWHEEEMLTEDLLPITVTEVRISPDLRSATAYIIPLGVEANSPVAAELVKLLNRHSKAIRYELGREVHLKFVPQLKFMADTVFEEARRIEALLDKPEVRRDTKA